MVSIYCSFGYFGYVVCLLPATETLPYSLAAVSAEKKGGIHSCFVLWLNITSLRLPWVIESFVAHSDPFISSMFYLIHKRVIVYYNIDLLRYSLSLFTLHFNHFSLLTVHIIHSLPSLIVYYSLALLFTLLIYSYRLLRTNPPLHSLSTIHQPLSSNFKTHSPHYPI